MKAQILKIAGVKNEAEFYKKFPTEEAFMKKHGKELKKAQGGAFIPTDPVIDSNYEMPNDGQSVGETGNFAFGTPGDLIAELNPKNKLKVPSKFARNAKDAAMNAANQLAPQLGSIIGNIEQIQQNKKDIKKANQWADVSKIASQAALSRPEQSRRRYVRPGDNLVTAANPLGKRDSLLAAQNGAEIQNTFAPNDIYTDMGYEPLNDSNPKQYVYGGYLPKAASGFDFNSLSGVGGSLGGMLGSAIGGGTGRGGAGSALGSTIGGALGNFIPIPGVGSLIGSTLGGLAGGLFDGSDQNQLQQAQDRQTAAINQAIVGAGASNLQKANRAFMYNGGYMNPEYNPQVIAKFGDYSMDQLLAPPHDADMLRAGGHLKEYTPPSARAMYTGRNQMEYGGQMAMGGDLQVHRGQAETMSYNPFLPDGGETVMFRGPSHDNGGMPISYGENGVEVEGGEPAVKLQDGGSPDGNLVVYGNMIIPDYGVAELGDKNAKGKKFKHYVADLSKIEAKQGKLIQKTTDLINNADTNDQFEKLSLNTGQANLIGATMKLKDIAEKKKTAAAVQNAILDTAKEMGVESDALAKGKIKYAKANDPYAEFGTKLTKAQGGKSVDPNDDWIRKILNYEITKGSATGGGLSNFGYNDWEQFGHTHAPRSMDEAVEYFKQDYLPKVDYLPLGLRGRAGDWAFNTGKDPRIPLLMAARKIKSNAFGLAGPRVELAQDPKALDELWNKHSAEITKKAKDPAFLKEFDKARKVMYQNINRLPDGSINPAYGKTWKGRTEEIFDYPDASVPTPVTPASATFAKPVNPTLQGSVSLSPIAETLSGSYIPEMSPKAIAAAKTAQQVAQAPSNLKFDIRNFLPKSMVPDQRIVNPPYLPTYTQWNPEVGEYVGEDIPQYSPKNVVGSPSVQAVTSSKPVIEESDEPNAKGKFPWDTLLTGANSMLPFLRPTNQIPLDPSQLSGELYALSQNQEEPVFAQSYQPMLSQPISISLQDQLNEITSQARAAERMAQGNPAALSMIAAQAADAKNKVLGEQFRMNQGEAQRVAETNRQTMNEAAKMNLGLFDQQQQRASQARSNTKMQNIVALNSINDKIMKQKAENRQVGLMENLYNYRFSPSGVAYNMNPLAQFNLAGAGAGKGMSGDLETGKDFSYNKAGKIIGIHSVGKDDSKKNGGIVKAIKNL
jgi:hypothetical protein